MFQNYNFSIDLAARPFDNLLYRDRTTLIVCKDPEGKFLLGAKKQYPAGIVRLMGGGVDKNEDTLIAAQREIKEEMGIDIDPEELIELAAVKIEGKFHDKTYNHTVYLYYLDSDKDDLVAGDDVSNIVTYDVNEFRQLIENFNSLLPDEFSDGDDPYSWGDYGKVYGFVHKVALDEVLKRGL